MIQAKTFVRTGLTDTEATLYTVPSGANIIIKEISVTNITATTYTLDLAIAENGVATTDTDYLLKGVEITGNETVVFPRSIVIEESYDIRGLAEADAVLNITVSGGIDETGTAGAGDMLKATYDTNDDGIVDKAAAVDDGTGLVTATAAQIVSAVDDSHEHSNKATLDAITYTPEDSGNKVSSFQETPTHDAFPTEKLVKDSLDLKSDSSHDHSGVYETSGAVSTHTAISDAHHSRYTDSEARAAAVNNSITDGNTTTAPSEDAVYDALANKVSVYDDDTTAETFVVRSARILVTDEVVGEDGDTAPTWSSPGDIIIQK
jgi:hypothetical protein